MMNDNFRNKKCYLVALVVFSIIVSGLTIGSALAQPKVKELKWASLFPEGDYNIQTMKQFCDSVNNYTNGSVKITFYSVGQIADVKELVEVVRTGAIAMGTTAPVHYPSVFPFNSVLQMYATAFKSPEQAAYIWRGLYRDIPEIQEEYAKQNQYCLNRTVLAKYVTLSKKPIRNLEDLKGLKIRDFPGKYFPAMMRKVGASSNPIPMADAYEGLSRGLIDAAMMNTPTIESLKFYETAKYICMPVGTFIAFHVSINLDVWNSFTLEIKKAFIRAANEWGANNLELQLTMENKSNEFLKTKGVQFIEFDQKDWKKLLAMGGDIWLAAKDFLVNDLKVNESVVDKFIKRWRELTDEYDQKYTSTGKKWKYE
jgi:TRAP-type C4-dicarboxylate transport system substrate-binding protein